MMYFSYNVGNKSKTVKILDNGDTIEEIHDWETGKNTTVIETNHLDANGIMTKTRHVKEY